MGEAFPFVRRAEALRDREFDVLVVGGGIYGAWTAYDAALRGLSVALIEKSDWGSGTSSASSKLIHGGLRYLEHYEFGLVRHALKERRTLFRIAPHLVRPLNFILPMWKGPRASPFLVSAGLTLYDVLAIGGQPVPRHRHYRAKALLRRYPFLDPERLLGGFRYGDCQEDDARMTLMVAAAAQAAGAVCVNHLKAERLIESAQGVAGADVWDRVLDQRFPIRAKVVVNASGPWMRSLLGDAAPAVKLIKGTHLLLPAIPHCPEAFLLTAKDGRVFFVIPWYGRTLVGTTEQAVQDPAQAVPTSDDVRYLLDGVRNGLPGLGWTERDVIACFAGVRMLQAASTEDLSAVTREFEVLQPRPRLIMHVGGKYTTARGDSSEIVDRVFAVLGRASPPSQTADRGLPGTPAEGFERWQPQALGRLVADGVDAEAAHALTLRHGTGIEALRQRIAARPELARRIHPEMPFLNVEAVHAVEAEMALTLDDVLRRRVPLQLLVRDGPWQQSLAQLLGAGAAYKGGAGLEAEMMSRLLA